MFNNSSSTIESSALAVRNSKKISQFCEHCQCPHHTRATCWKIHGKPADWVPRHLRNNDNKGMHASSKGPSTTSPSTTSVDLPFSKAQLEQLSKILAGSSTSLIASGTALNATSLQPAPWIIDSGSSDHMTGNRSLFSDYSPQLGSRFVKIADGSFTRVTGVGTIQLTNEYTLKNVLFVPSR